MNRIKSKQTKIVIKIQIWNLKILNIKNFKLMITETKTRIFKERIAGKLMSMLNILMMLKQTKMMHI